MDARRPLLFWCVAFLAVLYGWILLGAADWIHTDLMDYAGEEVLLTGRVVSVTRERGFAKIVLRASSVTRETDGETRNGETGESEGAFSGSTEALKERSAPLREKGEKQSSGGAPLHETVLLRVTGELSEKRLAGEEIAVWTTLERPSGKRNPGGFDYRLYLLGKRIAMTGEGPAAYLHKTGVRRPLLGLAANMRETFTERLLERTDRETAALLIAIVLGDTSLLEDETERAFRASGLSHLMAVSGLHVTLLFGWIAKTSRAPKGKKAIFRSFAFLLVYGWICSFSPSVTRGILMIVFRKTAELAHKRYDFKTAIGASAALSALFNPFRIVQTGFLLSYGAVLALALLLPPIEAAAEKRLRFTLPLPKRVLWETVKVLGASFAIAAGMAPLQLLLFQRLSPAALALNVPAIALSGIVMPLGFLLFLFANALEIIPLPFVLFAAFERIALFLEGILLSLLRLLAEIGSFFSIQTGGVSPLFVALFFGCIFFFMGEWYRMNAARNRRKVAFALVWTILITATLGFLADDSIGPNALTFVDVGQGDCLHLHERGFVREDASKWAYASVDFLIDGGGNERTNVGEETLLPYLRSQGVTRLDGVLATHLHTDHFKGLAEICRVMDVGGLILFHGYREREAEILRETGLRKEQLTYVSAGDTIVLSPDLSLEILWPEKGSAKEEENENAMSLVVRVAFRDLTCLMTADLDEEGEKALIASLEKRREAARSMEEENEGGAIGIDAPLRADVLKIAHHGSRFSSSEAFLKEAMPKAAVIQVGKNAYGHPSPATLEKLDAFGIMVYRNDTQGAVIVKPKKDGFRVRTMRR